MLIWRGVSGKMFVLKAPVIFQNWWLGEKGEVEKEQKQEEEEAGRTALQTRIDNLFVSSGSEVARDKFLKIILFCLAEMKALQWCMVLLPFGGDQLFC